MSREILKKAMLAGIGVVVKTKDEIEALAKEYVKKEKMSEKEGKKFLKDLQKKYDKEKGKVEEKVEKRVSELLKKGDIATSKDVAALKDEISDLKREMQKMKG